MSRPIPACVTCATLGGVDVDYECEELLEADVRLLNANKVHIVMTRDAHGTPAPITRETIHALAALLRALLASKGQTG